MEIVTKDDKIAVLDETLFVLTFDLNFSDVTTEMFEDFLHYFYTKIFKSMDFQSLFKLWTFVVQNAACSSILFVPIFHQMCILATTGLSKDNLQQIMKFLSFRKVIPGTFFKIWSNVLNLENSHQGTPSIHECAQQILKLCKKNKKCDASHFEDALSASSSEHDKYLINLRRAIWKKSRFYIKAVSSIVCPPGKIAIVTDSMGFFVPKSLLACIPYFKNTFDSNFMSESIIDWKQINIRGNIAKKWLKLIICTDMKNIDSAIGKSTSFVKLLELYRLSNFTNCEDLSKVLQKVLSRRPDVAPFDLLIFYQENKYGNEIQQLIYQKIYSEMSLGNAYLFLSACQRLEISDTKINDIIRVKNPMLHLMIDSSVMKDLSKHGILNSQFKGFQSTLMYLERNQSLFSHNKTLENGSDLLHFNDFTLEDKKKTLEKWIYEIQSKDVSLALLIFDLDDLMLKFLEENLTEFETIAPAIFDVFTRIDLNKLTIEIIHTHYQHINYIPRVFTLLEGIFNHHEIVIDRNANHPFLELIEHSTAYLTKLLDLSPARAIHGLRQLFGSNGIALVTKLLSQYIFPYPLTAGDEFIHDFLTLFVKAAQKFSNLKIPVREEFIDLAACFFAALWCGKAEYHSPYYEFLLEYLCPGTLVGGIPVTLVVIDLTCQKCFSTPLVDHMHKITRDFNPTLSGDDVLMVGLQLSFYFKTLLIEKMQDERLTYFVHEILAVYLPKLISWAEKHNFALLVDDNVQLRLESTIRTLIGCCKVYMFEFDGINVKLSNFLLPMLLPFMVKYIFPNIANFSSYSNCISISVFKILSDSLTRGTEWIDLLIKHEVFEGLDRILLDFISAAEKSLDAKKGLGFLCKWSEKIINFIRIVFSLEDRSDSIRIIKEKCVGMFNEKILDALHQKQQIWEPNSMFYVEFKEFFYMYEKERRGIRFRDILDDMDQNKK